MKSRIYILCLILVATSSLGFDSSCKKTSSNTDTNLNTNASQMPKTQEEKIADFKKTAAEYRHRIENGLVRFIEFKRELKKNKKLNAAQDLALNETLNKLNDATDNIGRLIAKADVTKLNDIDGILDEISSLSTEASNTILLFTPKESAGTVSVVVESIRTAIAGLRLTLTLAKQEFVK